MGIRTTVYCMPSLYKICRIACKALRGRADADVDTYPCVIAIPDTGNAHQAAVAMVLLSDHDQHVRLQAVRPIGVIAEAATAHARVLGSLAVDESSEQVRQAAQEVSSVVSKCQ